MRLVHESRLSLTPLVLAELPTPPTLPYRPATELTLALTILHLSGNLEARLNPSRFLLISL